MPRAATASNHSSMLTGTSYAYCKGKMDAWAMHWPYSELWVCCLHGQCCRDCISLQELRPRPYQVLQVGRLGCLVDLLVVGLESVGRVSRIDAALCSTGQDTPDATAPCFYRSCLGQGMFLPILGGLLPCMGELSI